MMDSEASLEAELDALRDENERLCNEIVYLNREVDRLERRHEGCASLLVDYKWYRDENKAYKERLQATVCPQCETRPPSLAKVGAGRGYCFACGTFQDA